MATVTEREIESGMQAQLVEEFLTLGSRYSLNLFGAVKLQVVQLDGLLERIDRKAATALQVLKSKNTIKSDVPYLKGKISQMENTPALKRMELGDPFPSDDPKNTLEKFKEMVTKLDGADAILEDVLPQLEKEDAERIKLQGQRLFALSVVAILGLLFIRSKW